MPTIEQDVAAIRTAVYGKDVREAIADGIENCYGNTTSAAQIAQIEQAAQTCIGQMQQTAQQVISSIPSDYTSLSNTVNGLEYDVEALSDKFYDKNLFEPNFIVGKYVNNVTGDLFDNVSHKATNYIPIKEAIKYTISWYTDIYPLMPALRVAFYDAEQIFISGLYEAGSHEINYTFTTPNNAAYIRFSIAISLHDIQLEIGFASTSYKKYGDQVITPFNTTFFDSGINMIDPRYSVPGEYVNQVTGQFGSSSGHIRTDFIPIHSGRYYCLSGVDNLIRNTFRYAWYTEDRVFISGRNMADNESKSILAPNNAAYLIVSAASPSWPIMVAETEKIYQYSPYSPKLRDEFLPSHNAENIILNVPSKIYALVGYETNVYFENLTYEWEKYDWDVSGSVGMQLERGFRITPTANDVGEYSIGFTMYLDGSVVKSASTTLVVSAANANSGVTKKVIILGDSTTNSGFAVAKLNANFSSDVMNVQTLGTRGTSPNNHEGRSGWTLERYFTTEVDSESVVNAFYNPSTLTFDADYYFTNSGVSKPDWFFINLGINDMFGYTTDAACESAIADATDLMNDMITSVKSASPNTKIGVCLTIPPNHSQDAFGKAYGMGQTRKRYKKNNTMWVAELIKNFDNKTAQNIYLVPIHCALDTVWNMGIETIPVNARNTDITYQSPVTNGGVHPDEKGYWQIADVYTAFLKGN